ncbi:MAG: SpoIIE family protein phosphatase [Acidobacteriia bacterium]|nr:SpoIIE family protein phosphatase [Terriglobia bacterium]
MRLVPLEIESKLRDKGLWPQTWTARAAIYVLAVDLVVFALQMLLSRLSPGASASLAGWVSFLSFLAATLYTVVAFRWLRSQLLWRLRNRLIVTYVFIGVIPVLLLGMISLITLYLLAGQFASFVVTSEITARLRSMEASNRAIAKQISLRYSQGVKPSGEAIGGMRPQHREWSRRQVCAWYRNQAQPNCAGPAGAAPFDAPGFVNDDFREIVRDHGALYLRTATVIGPEPESLRVIASEPLDQSMVVEMAADLGEITLYGTLNTPAVQPKPSDAVLSGKEKNKQGITIIQGGAVSGDGRQFEPTFTAGAIPPASNAVDHEITFGTPLAVVDWASATGERQRAGALVRVQTRPSILYARLFAALGDFAKGVEYILLFIAIVFAIIELLALWIGTRLTRSITSAVAQLYEATKHVNRGDFSHRIKVKSNDQLATLANSFNSMTASIEKLIQEQKEKQRLEGELAIAQEVQAQLYPKEIVQLESLEVHGFCRPARTVSGDYYDFLSLNSDKMILAVGDISGKGISAALLMATIHSAVRAYSIEGIPLLREPAAVGAAAGSGLMLASEIKGAEVSPASLLGLLNHQLLESTPAAKYATLFLGIYDGATRRLTYSNGGHLPPILISEDGSSEPLSCSGTVVGLLDHVDYPESTVQLHHGDLFVAYSDGVTEPENDYGEFGEERLIQIVRENRHLPLARITEIVTAAVEDWIGDNEQPDDVTLVLARAR